MKARTTPGGLRGSAGTSILELVSIMGLLGVFSAFAFSSLQPYVGNYRVKGAAAEIAAELSRARAEAIRTRLCHFFAPAGGVQFKIVRDNQLAPDCQLDAGDQTVRTISLAAEHPGVTFSAGGATVDPYGTAITGPLPTSLRFEPRGLVTGAGGSTIFLLGEDSYSPTAVTVTVAGSIRIWHQESSGWQ